MKLNIPEQANKIIEALEEKGYEAFVVGGCVRDCILGRTPGDWDITTSAKPNEVKEIFTRTVDTGIEHGTVTVLMGKESYEVTTYRLDGEYEDHRHPKEVLFTSNLKEDLKRRDFTINAMAYNLSMGLIDIFEGVSDLKRKQIRCVGDANERFNEDALRILRAIRFSAQLGFEIDKKTKDAMKEKASDLKIVSAERVRVELVKMLNSAHPNKIHDAYEMGILKIILPEYEQLVKNQKEKEMLKAFQRAEANTILRWSILLREISSDSKESAKCAKKIMKRLKFDNYTLERVCRLVQWSDYAYTTDPSGVRKALNIIGADIFPYHIQLQKAYASMDMLKVLDEIEKQYQGIIERNECFEIKKMNVNGRDLMEHGIAEGPMIGKVLEELLQRVIKDQSLNQKERLLDLAKEIYGTFNI